MALDVPTWWGKVELFSHPGAGAPAVLRPRHRDRRQHRRLCRLRRALLRRQAVHRPRRRHQLGDHEHRSRLRAAHLGAVRARPRGRHQARPRRGGSSLERQRPALDRAERRPASTTGRTFCRGRSCPTSATAATACPQALGWCRSTATRTRARSRTPGCSSTGTAPTRRRRAQKEPPRGAAPMKTGGDLLSRALAGQVPSALRGLTSLFGMGRGVSPSL